MPCSRKQGECGQPFAKGMCVRLMFTRSFDQNENENEMISYPTIKETSSDKTIFVYSLVFAVINSVEALGQICTINLIFYASR